MSRMPRLLAVREVQLRAGAFRLGATQRDVAALAAVGERLDGLREEIAPGAGAAATAEVKAAAAARAALLAAGERIARRLAASSAARGAAAEDLARLQAARDSVRRLVEAAGDGVAR